MATSQIKTIIFDSSVWVAYYNSKDFHHQRALKIINQAIQHNHRIVTGQTIIIEVINVLAREGSEADAIKQIYLKLSGYAEQKNLALAEQALLLVTKIRLKSNDLIIMIEALMDEPDVFTTFDQKLSINYEKVSKNYEKNN